MCQTNWLEYIVFGYIVWKCVNYSTYIGWVRSSHCELMYEFWWKFWLSGIFSIVFLQAILKLIRREKAALKNHGELLLAVYRNREQGRKFEKISAEAKRWKGGKTAFQLKIGFKKRQKRSFWPFRAEAREAKEAVNYAPDRESKLASRVNECTR